jgi:hypothetical protein
VKTISRETYLQAVGLFTLSQAANAQLQQCHDTLLKILGYDQSGPYDNYMGHVSDAMWGEAKTIKDFDRALKLQGIAIEPTPASQPENDAASHSLNP